MKLDADIKYFKAKLFALRIFKLCKYLKQEKSEYEIAKQIFRSGTSIGANIAEAQYNTLKAILILYTNLE